MEATLYLFTGRGMFLVCFFFSALVSGGELTEVWSLNKGLSGPSSVSFDHKSGALYVSNIAGGPTEKNGKGYISKVGLNGTLLTEKWIDGLNSPKGIQVYDGRLWVAVVDEVRAYKLPSEPQGPDRKFKDGEFIHKITIDGAQCLDDVELSLGGTVYVSDIFANRIYRIINRWPYPPELSLFYAGDFLNSPNGLLASAGELLIASSDLPPNQKEEPPAKGKLTAIDLTNRKVRQIGGNLSGQLDGIIETINGLLVSEFSTSTIYRVSREGSAEKLLQVEGQIAYLSSSSQYNLLFVPLTKANSVRAYRYPLQSQVTLNYRNFSHVILSGTAEASDRS